MEKNALLIVLCLAICHPVIEAKQECIFEGLNIWKPCGKENISSTDCKALGCCFAPEEYLRSRNITWRCLSPASTEIQNGTCVKYTGLACAPYMVNDTDFGHALHYVDSSYGINGTDAIFKSFFSMTQISVKQQACLSLLPHAICHYGLPECLDSGEPEPICREDCDYVMDICTSDMPGLLAIIEYNIFKEKIKFTHLSLPRCERLRYSYEYPDPNGIEDCNHVYNIDRQRKTKKRSVKLIPIIIGVGACVLLIIIIVAITIVCLKRRQAQRDKLYTNDFPFLSSMVSMRDRIQQDAVGRSPLADLLQNAQPGELVQYPLDKVEYIDDLGEGQFGKVFRGRVHGVKKDEETTDVAVKCLKVSSGSQAEEAFKQEVTLMSMLDHPNILRLLAVSLEEKPYCMIFEYMVNGDLSEFLRKSEGKFADSDFIKMAKHIASGMEYLASKRFVHRDLATRNCLVGEKLIVKIADFGMSRDIYSSDYYRVGGEAMLPIRWMPPEAILYGKFTIAADVYSFGVVLWELFTCGLQPFYGYSNDEVVDFIKKGVLLPRPDECPEWIWSIMLLCWKREPEERITMTRALQLLKGDDEGCVPPDVLATPTAAASEESRRKNDEQIDSSAYDQVPRIPIPKPATNEPNARYHNMAKSVSSKSSEELAARGTKNVAFHDYDEVGSQRKQPNQGATNSTVALTINDPLDFSPNTLPRSGSKEMLVVDDESDETRMASLKFPPTKSSTLKSTGSNSHLRVESQRSSVSSKRSNTSPSASPVPSVRNFFRRAGSIRGRRSIRDVMMKDARYVGAKDIKKKPGKPVVAEPSAPGHAELEYRPSIMPSSEFFSYHKQGDEIHADSDNERRLLEHYLAAGPVGPVGPHARPATDRDLALARHRSWSENAATAFTS